MEHVLTTETDDGAWIESLGRLSGDAEKVLRHTVYSYLDLLCQDGPENIPRGTSFVDVLEMMRVHPDYAYRIETIIRFGTQELT